MENGANVLGELDDGTYLDTVSLDSVVKLRRDHGVLRQNVVGDHESVPLLSADELNIDHMHQQLQLQVAAYHRRDDIWCQVHGHFEKP
ncbi:hypothetical protein PS2_028607 [Malus domestica]